MEAEESAIWKFWFAALTAARPADKRGRREQGPKPTLAPDAARKLFDQLLLELTSLADPEALAAWAHRVLPLKNQLSKDDAQTVEAAFAERLQKVGDAAEIALPGEQGSDKPRDGAKPGADVVTTITKPVRERDRNHLRFVATQPCLVCGRTPSDAHHLKFAERPAMGRKVSDKFTVPVCRIHHRDLHRRGNERSWWEGQGIDPLPIAANLWQMSHADLSANDGHPGFNGKHPAVEPVIRRRNTEAKSTPDPQSR